ncbi:RNA-binding protein, partial [Xenorhabdus bovienii]|uniref:RNA-binding protein n=1 Tax=Xenorhabdus bovienii TaxID=40576 RepID=UPI0023B344EB
NLAEKYQIDSINRIKPGIAEATRAVLRRVPEHILVRSKDDPDVALLVHLARQKNVVITEVVDLIGQYRAVTIIKKVA